MAARCKCPIDEETSAARFQRGLFIDKVVYIYSDLIFSFELISKRKIPSSDIIFSVIVKTKLCSK